MGDCQDEVTTGRQAETAPLARIFDHDLFISYADADRAWVEGYLLDALAQAGVHYHTEAAFALGVLRLLEFERAVQQSRRTLLVLSSAYLAEGFTQFTDLLIIRLWDLQTQEAITLRAHGPRWASGVAFSADGSLLYSAGGDGQVRAWPVPTVDVLALACRRVGRNLTEAEWQAYLPFLPFTELCQGAASAPWVVSEQLDPPRPMPSPALPVADDRPTIYYFEAVPGSVVRFGESVTLRWDVAGAASVYLEYQGQRYGKTAPGEELFLPAEDTTYQLVAVNPAGERSVTLTISVSSESPIAYRVWHGQAMSDKPHTISHQPSAAVMGEGLPTELIRQALHK